MIRADARVRLAVAALAAIAGGCTANDSLAVDSAAPAAKPELPSGWVPLTHLGVDYACQRVNLGAGGDLDCVRMTDPLPASISDPDLRCSPSVGSYECTTDSYYPSEFDGLERLSYNGQQYVCEAARLAGSDYDCVPWSGGDLPVIDSPAIRCTKRGTSFDCTSESYYPSELDGFEIAQIDGNKVICQLDRCWIWNPRERPSVVSLGPPDYECSANRCAQA